MLAALERPVYQYLFTAESPALGGARRSAHCIEVGFVFGTHELRGQEEGFFGSGPTADALSKSDFDRFDKLIPCVVLVEYLSDQLNKLNIDGC